MVWPSKVFGSGVFEDGSDLSVIIGASEEGEVENTGERWKETEEMQSRAND